MWTGVKDSGRGVSLSKFGEYSPGTLEDCCLRYLSGYDQLTRAKSVHMKIKTT